MAQNERFNALQREKLCGLMTALGVTEVNLNAEVDAGIQEWRFGKFGSTNPNSVSDQIHDIIDKFRMHNLTAQANQFDEELDNFIDRALVKDGHGNSELHWGIIQMLIETSNAPTRNLEIINPNFKSNTNEVENIEDSDDSSADYNPDSGQWEESLSTWSEVTISDDEEGITTDVISESNTNTFPPVPTRFADHARAELVILEDEIAKAKEKNKYWQLYPIGKQPWVDDEPMGRFVGGIMDELPVSKTLIHWIECELKLHKLGFGDGFDFGNHYVAYEKTCQIWLAEACCGSVENNLVKWDDETSEAYLNPSIVIQHASPKWQNHMKMLLPLITNVMRLSKAKDKLSKRHHPHNVPLREFLTRIWDLLDFRIFTFFRRWEEFCRKAENCSSIFLLVETTLKQTFHEGMKITSIALEVIDIDEVTSPSDVNCRMLSILFDHMPDVYYYYQSFLPEYAFILKRCLLKRVRIIQIFSEPTSVAKRFDEFPFWFTDVPGDQDNFLDNCVAKSDLVEVKPLKRVMDMLYEIMRMRRVLQTWDVYPPQGARQQLAEFFDEHFDDLACKLFGKRVIPDDHQSSEREWYTYVPMFDEEFLRTHAGTWRDRLEGFKQGIPNDPVPNEDYEGLLRLKIPKVGRRIRYLDEDWFQDFIQPVEDHLAMKLKVYQANFNSIDFKSYIEAHIDFFVGDNGDIINDIAHLMRNGELHEYSVIDAIEDCPRYSKFAFNVSIDRSRPMVQQLKVSFQMPPMLKTVINEQCRKSYQKVFERTLLLKLSHIGIQKDLHLHKTSVIDEIGEIETISDELFITGVTDDSAHEVIWRKHIQLIIPVLYSNIHLAMIKPIVNRYREKTSKSTTIFDLIEFHEEMVSHLEKTVLFSDSPLIGKKIQNLLYIAKDFDKALQNRRIEEDFVRLCSDLRTLTKKLSEQQIKESLSISFDALSDVLYYTDERNKARNDQLTAAMRFKGVKTEKRYFFPSVNSTPVKKRK